MDRNDVLAHIWATSEAGSLIPICAWCGRLRIGDEWVEPPARALSTIDERLTLSHSICPACAATSSARKKEAGDPGG